MKQHDKAVRLAIIKKRMLEIEDINMSYNIQTMMGTKPNGRESEIETLLAEWDSLKVERNMLK